jgi:hypothetical protein
VREVVTIDAQISSTVQAMGLEKEQRGQFTQAVQAGLADAQRVKGKPLTFEERQKVIDQQTMQVTVPGFLWDTTRRAFEVRNTPDAMRAQVSVPKGDRDMIVQAFEAVHKRKPTDAEVLSTYKAKNGIR